MECLNLLERMPVQPDVISYNVAMHALARSGWSDAGIRAQTILESMINPSPASSDGGNSSTGAVAVKPNGRSYTTCMDAWSQCGRSDMALSLLKQQLDLFDKTGEISYKPNAVSYATALHSLAASKDPNKAVKAFRLVQEMKDRNIPKNRFVWNNLLHCFATSRPNPMTVELVQKLYQQILERSDPDHYTFGTVLKAASNLFVWKTDRDFAPSVFREACDRGHVSDGVLWHLRQAVPVDTFRDLVGSDDIDITCIPSEWKRNVRGSSNWDTATMKSSINTRRGERRVRR